MYNLRNIAIAILRFSANNIRPKKTSKPKVWTTRKGAGHTAGEDALSYHATGSTYLAERSQVSFTCGAIHSGAMVLKSDGCRGKWHV